MAVTSISQSSIAGFGRRNTMTPTPAGPSVTSTTGSPTVSSAVEISGVVYDIYTFDGSGSMTFAGTGAVDVFVLSGGGAGNGGYSTSGGYNAGGGGGGVYYGAWRVTDGSYTVTVGAGGVATSGAGRGGQGGFSEFGALKVGGGTGGYSRADFGGTGISTSGVGGGAGDGAFGNDNNGFSRYGGGVGGTVFGANYYSGRTIDITGTGVEYGNARTDASNGSANTGEGGGAQIRNGGSGKVIVRVAV